MRKATITGFVGTDPEACHGKEGGKDYVKFRFGSKEWDDRETWWFTVLVYGQLAVTVLGSASKRGLKAKDRIIVYGKLLKPRANNASQDGTLILSDFEWINSTAPKEEETPSTGKDAFNFGDFDSIPEIEF